MKKTKDKDIEQDEKLDELKKKNELQDDVMFNNFKNLYGLNSTNQKAISELEKITKQLYSAGVSKEDLEKVQEAIQKIITDIQENSENDKESNRILSERIGILRSDLKNSLKKFEGMIKNDKTMELVKQNLKDDIARWLDQQTTDNKQNERIRHLETEKFFQNRTDDRQTDSINSNKDSLNKLHNDLYTFISKESIFNKEIKRSRTLMWVGLSILTISNILLWIFK